MYRRAIDDALAGKDFDMSLMDELESLSNRGYTEYNRHPAGEFQNYEHGHRPRNGTSLSAKLTWMTRETCASR